MFEEINEPVRVLAGFESRSNSVRVTPYLLDWRGNRYHLDRMGLHHPAQRGEKQVHVFEFASETTKFKVELDTETLGWTLKEAFYDH